MFRFFSVSHADVNVSSWWLLKWLYVLFAARRSMLWITVSSGRYQCNYPILLMINLIHVSLVRVLTNVSTDQVLG